MTAQILLADPRRKALTVRRSSMMEVVDVVLNNRFDDRHEFTPNSNLLAITYNNGTKHKQIPCLPADDVDLFSPYSLINFNARLAVRE